MAHTKAQGSSRNGRDSSGKRLGVKAHDSSVVHSGTIILRQRGTKIRPGVNVGMGRDHTLYAKADGIVKFKTTGRGKTANIEPVAIEKA